MQQTVTHMLRTGADETKRQRKCSSTLFGVLLLLVCVQLLILGKDSSTVDLRRGSTVAKYDRRPPQGRSPSLVRYLPSKDPSDFTHQPYYACSEGFVRIEDSVVNTTNSTNHHPSNIPRIIHQTSKSRCMTGDFVNKSTYSWRTFGLREKDSTDTTDWSYYFWDDAAVMQLFRSHYPEFPNLQGIVEHCLPTGTLRADLWRYLVLYTYGGVYSDVDSSARPLLHPNTILYPPPNQTRTSNHTFHTNSLEYGGNEAFFIIETFGLLSQYFLASAPRHPLLYYTIQQILYKVYEQKDTGKISAPGFSGPHALARGFQRFLKEGGYSGYEANCDSYQSYEEEPCVLNKTYVGVDGWTVTVVGDPLNADTLVERDAVAKKLDLYSKMNMTHFDVERNGKGTGYSCMNALRQSTLKNV